MQKLILILFLAHMTSVCLSKNVENGCLTKQCDCNVAFEKETYLFREAEKETVAFNLTCANSINITEIKRNLYLDLKNSSLYRVKNWTIIDENVEDAGITGLIEIKALVTGVDELEISSGDNECIIKKILNLKILRRDTLMSIYYPALVGTLATVVNVAFGCALDPRVILKIVKKPIAPCLGFACQFLIMAPLAALMAKIANIDPLYGLGLVAIGSSPGGGGSNFCAALLDGDLELSITMTTFSTIGALFMTPFWFWVFGRLFLVNGAQITIPVVKVVIFLAAITIPSGIGMILRYRKPKIADILTNLLKPILIVIIIIIVVLSIYAHYDILKTLDWKVPVVALLFSYIGYSIGAVVSIAAGLKYRQIVTVSLETGVQNMSVGLVMISFALPPYEAEKAGTAVLCFACTSMPLAMTAVFWRIISHKETRQNFILQSRLYYLVSICKKKEEEDGTITRTVTEQDCKLEPLVEKV